MVIQMSLNENNKPLFSEAYKLAQKLNQGKSYHIPLPPSKEDFSDSLVHDDRRIKLANYLLNAADGSIEKQYTDFRLLCLAGEITIRRRYHTDGNRMGLLGRGWVLDYESYCALDNNSLTLTQPDGTKERFTKRDDHWVNADPSSLTAVISEDRRHDEFTIQKSNQFYIYGFDGRLKKITDRNNNYIELCYMNGTGLIDRTISSCGKYLTFKYRDNKISAITDNIGRSVKYSYEKDLLTQVEMANGGKYNFSYDGVHKKLAAVTDANGRSEFRAKYDRHGNPVGLYKDSDCDWQVSRDARSRTLTLSSNGEQLVFQYDRAGLLKEIESGGNVQRFEYDKNGMMITTQGNSPCHSKAQRSKLGSFPEERLFPCAQTDSRPDIITKEDEPSKTSYCYDAFGRLLETIRPDGSWKRREYEEHGLIAKLTKSNGYEKRWEYDRTGNLLTVKENLDKGLTAVTQYQRDARGRVIKETDPNKNVIQYIYKTDNSLYPETTIYPNGYRLERQYDDVNRLIRENNIGSEISCQYNNLDMPVKTFYPNGAHDFKRYDLMGKLVDVITPREVLLSEKEKRTAKKFRYTYDEENKLLYITTPTGRRMTPGDSKKYQKKNSVPGEIRLYNYAGLIVERRIPATFNKQGEQFYQLTQYAYDKNANLINEKQSAEPVMKDELPSSFTSKTYGYDDRNNMNYIHTNSGEDRKYFYRGVNRLVRETIRINEDKEQKLKYTYNEMGLLLEKTELMDPDDADMEAFGKDAKDASALKIKTGFTYDENGNLMSMALPDGSRVTLEYDADGLLVPTPEISFLVEAMPDAGEQEQEQKKECKELAKDKYGRIIKAIWADGYFETYTYDSANNMSGITDMNGRTTQYFYNSINKLKRVIEPSGEVKEFLYWPDGRITKEVYSISSVLKEKEVCL